MGENFPEPRKDSNPHISRSTSRFKHNKNDFSIDEAKWENLKIRFYRFLNRNDGTQLTTEQDLLSTKINICPFTFLHTYEISFKYEDEIKKFSNVTKQRKQCHQAKLHRKKILEGGY